MQRKTRWITGAAAAGALLIGATVATGASAQTAPTPGAPVAGFCSGVGMMGGYGPRAGANVGTFGPGAVHDAIATALGITSKELWDARAAGKSVAELAQDKNVSLDTVVDAALAAHSAQLDAAVQASTLSKAQADAMTQFMRSRLETQLQAAPGLGGFGPGMMGGFGFGPGRRIP